MTRTTLENCERYASFLEFRLWRLICARSDRPNFPRDGFRKKFAASGGLVLGICNGFQILAEVRLAFWR